VTLQGLFGSRFTANQACGLSLSSWRCWEWSFYWTGSTQLLSEACWGILRQLRAQGIPGYPYQFYTGQLVSIIKVRELVSMLGMAYAAPCS